MGRPPNSQTAARRRRRLLRLSGELDELLGFDHSSTAYRFIDGWRIVRMTRMRDQRREGFLMGNCLALLPSGVAWSLRDEDNLPHCTFRLWRLDEGDFEIVEESARYYRSQPFIATERVLLLCDRSRLPKRVHVKRLREFVDSAELADRRVMRHVPWPEESIEMVTLCAFGNRLNFGSGMDRVANMLLDHMRAGWSVEEAAASSLMGRNLAQKGYAV